MRKDSRWRIAGEFQPITSPNGSSPAQNRTPFKTQLRRSQTFLRQADANPHRQRLSIRRNYGSSEPEKTRGRRNVSASVQLQERQTTPGELQKRQRRSGEVRFGGNRREPSFQWRSGLREPKRSSARDQSNEVYSLFVDKIPQGLATTWLRHLFQRFGLVVDIFISTKIRKSCKDGFGFVRYSTIEAATKAIANLNGLAVQGRRLQVSMAKYQKGGVLIQQKSPSNGGKGHGNNKIMNPALRDHRKYSEVVLGIQKKIESIESKLEGRNCTIPIHFSLNVDQNEEMASMMNRAVIAENTEVLNLPQIQATIANCDENVTGMFLLSPTKLLVVFACENDAIKAVNSNGSLWNSFDDIRPWSEGESFDDRLVWVDCVGIHPLCWSEQNLKLIGPKWGPVIQIENRVQGVEKITGARLLLRTKAQNRIDSRIKLFSEQATCDVWVKEYFGNGGESCEGGNRGVTQQPPAHSWENGLNPNLSDPLANEMSNTARYESDREWVDPVELTEDVN